jgi:hypothetical protein
MTITTTVGLTTQIKKIVVGTPVKRVTSGAFNVNNIAGIDTTGATTGSLLIYSTATSTWVASKNLEEQTINGGSY